MNVRSHSSGCYKWTSWFLSSKDKEYFCEVEEGYILDGFNLTGPNNEQVFDYAPKSY
jgi:hypothetical protein